MTKPKPKPRQTTLKAHLKHPSIRLSKKDQERLWTASADLAVDNFRKSIAKCRTLQRKLMSEMALASEFAQNVLTFAVKSDWQKNGK